VSSPPILSLQLNPLGGGYYRTHYSDEKLLTDLVGELDNLPEEDVYNLADDMFTLASLGENSTTPVEGRVDVKHLIQLVKNANGKTQYALRRAIHDGLTKLGDRLHTLYYHHYHSHHNRDDQGKDDKSVRARTEDDATVDEVGKEEEIDDFPLLKLLGRFDHFVVENLKPALDKLGWGDEAREGKYEDGE
jgi:hypothetical protein